MLFFFNYYSKDMKCKFFIEKNNLSPILETNNSFFSSGLQRGDRQAGEPAPPASSAGRPLGTTLRESPRAIHIPPRHLSEGP